MRLTAKLLGVAPLVVAAACAPGRAQPPPPLPMHEVAFPPFVERSLSNGARLIVVPQHEVPFVTVNVIVPGGVVGDPEGKEGTATFVAELVTRGTLHRSAADIAATVDRLGISLAAVAEEEWSTLTLDATSSALDEGLAILADALTDAAFPTDEVERTRAQALTGLQVQKSRPAAVADLAFAQALFGKHPYGRRPTDVSVTRLTRQDLLDFHRAWYRPDGALIVVAGDVDDDDISRRIETVLQDWEPRGRPKVDFPRAPDRTGVEIKVVHQPGSAQAEIRVGHLLAGGDLEGWEELVVANQLLGGGPPGRLQQVLRGARGYTYDARSTLTRLRRLGVFQVTTAARAEVAGAAIEEILAQVERWRQRATPGGELDDSKSFLVGSFPRSIETPQQVASQLATHRLLGLGDDDLTEYRGRVAAVDTARARAAAERWVRPEHFVVLVAGDAVALQPQLRGLGEVSIVDVDGRPLRFADLGARASTEEFDLSGLAPTTLSYDVRIAGVSRGVAVRTLERVDAGWRFASRIEAGPQKLEQAIVVDDALGFVSSRNHTVAGGRETLLTTRYVDGTIVGSSERAGGEETIELPVPEGVTLSDGLELALWAADLEVGREIHLPVADLRTRSVDNVLLRVEERMRLPVGDHTWDVFRVSVSGPDPQTLFVRAEGPHIPVRLQSASQPVVLDLVGGAGH